MTAFLVLLAAIALYLISCRIWPYTACSRCKGSPKDRSPGGKHWRDCSRCGGSGKRLRFGAALFTDGSRRR